VLKKSTKRKRPELFPHLQKIERGINPNTGKPFRDKRSRVLPCGRVLCKGQDMTDLREQVGKRESEICQHCEEWAQLYPPDGHEPGEMHHIHGRGMGGGKRDDLAQDMEWLCKKCHANAKIKRRDYSGVAE
jgi:hypothetical protein